MDHQKVAIDGPIKFQTADGYMLNTQQRDGRPQDPRMESGGAVTGNTPVGGVQREQADCRSGEAAPSRSMAMRACGYSREGQIGADDPRIRSSLRPGSCCRRRSGGGADAPQHRPPIDFASDQIELQDRANPRPAAGNVKITDSTNAAISTQRGQLLRCRAA